MRDALVAVAAGGRRAGAGWEGYVFDSRLVLLLPLHVARYSVMKYRSQRWRGVRASTLKCDFNANGNAG